jgi:sialate O-acetylesterase
MLHRLRLVSTASLLLLAGPLSAMAAADPAPRPFLSPVFGEHMMLQRGKTNRLWGWAGPGAEIRIDLAGHRIAATTDAAGRWEARLTPPPAGGPYELKIDGPQHLEFHDVLVGDIWVCGGQSNMAFGLTESRDGTAAVQQSPHPGIRLYRVTQQSAYGPAAVPRGEWLVCQPEAFIRPGGFSAVAYYFGRKIHEATGVPVGLIQDCVGGSPAESWMSPETLGRRPEFTAPLAEIARLKARGGPEYGNFVMHWFDEFDRGLAGSSWAAPDLDDTAWKPVTLKGAFADLGVPATPAVVWFRREIVLPDVLPPGPARIFLGVVEKMDTTWFNGRWVGASSWVENPRIYTIPADALHPGRNLVAIRVLKLKPDGGFQSPAAGLRLELGDGTAVPLEGAWKAAVSVDARPPHPLPFGYENYPTMPSVLYLGMLRPLAPLAVTGVIWYQGEANFTRARQYRELLPALIADWRALFAQADLPFYIVSLPAFMARRAQPGGDGWAAIRDVQARTVRTTPHTALAVTVDTGDAGNIHPPDKQPVGERLALAALRHTYGADVVSEGPVFMNCERLPGRLRLHFTGTDGGLVVRGERLGEFSVAGTDRVWHWAEAQLEGETVVVSSPLVPDPVAARYAWQANPLATLGNGAGLPAAPFRTDDWPLEGDPEK